MTDFLDKAPLPTTTASGKDVTVTPCCVHCEQEIVHDSFRSKQWASVASGSRYREGLRHEPAAPVGEPLTERAKRIINIVYSFQRPGGGDISQMRPMVEDELRGLLAAPLKTAPPENQLWCFPVRIGSPMCGRDIPNRGLTYDLKKVNCQQCLSGVVHSIRNDTAPLKTYEQGLRDGIEKTIKEVDVCNCGSNCGSVPEWRSVNMRYHGNSCATHIATILRARLQTEAQGRRRSSDWLGLEVGRQQ